MLNTVQMGSGIIIADWIVSGVFQLTILHTNLGFVFVLMKMVIERAPGGGGADFKVYLNMSGRCWGALDVRKWKYCDDLTF